MQITDATRQSAEKHIMRHLRALKLIDPQIQRIEIDEENTNEVVTAISFFFSDAEGSSHGNAYFFANDTVLINTDLDNEAEEIQPPTWHCSQYERGGALLYTLRQEGWRKGEPIMVNDLMIKVEPDHNSTTDCQPLISKLMTFLNS